MEEIKEIVSIYSPEVLGGKMLNEKDEVTRDEMKGQILAWKDLQFAIKSGEGKELGKFKGWLERFDVYDQNLDAFIQVVDQRAERVFAAKIQALELLKTNLLAYLKDYATTTESDGGVHSDEVEKKETGTGAESESEVPQGDKAGK